MNESGKELALKYGYDKLIMEAECVEMYGEWLHINLMGYLKDDLLEMAQYAKEHGMY